jgi:hypothetical protein
VTGRVLAALVTIGLAVTLSACTGSSRSGGGKQASAAAAAPGGSARSHAAYQRIGGAAQGVSLEVPGSWITVNFSDQTVKQAVGVLGGQGASVDTSLTQELTPLAKLHAVYAADVSSASTAPGHFATNLNAYCASSGISQAGSAGVAIIGRTWASELEQVGAQNLTQTAARLGKTAGVRSSYTLSTSSAGQLHAVQLEVLPESGRACFVTLTAAGPVPATVLSRAVATIQYP